MPQCSNWTENIYVITDKNSVLICLVDLYPGIASVRYVPIIKYFLFLLQGSDIFYFLVVQN